jgi:glycerol uptake facilitator-like aquaporin
LAGSGGLVAFAVVNARVDQFPRRGQPDVRLSGGDVVDPHRSAGHMWLGEVVATAGLVVLIFALARSGRAAVAPAAVGAYIGAAYRFTSSTSFANPAVTVGRAFTDTFGGIAPASVLGYLAAQLVGAVFAVGLLVVLYPPRAGPPTRSSFRTTSRPPT